MVSIRNNFYVQKKLFGMMILTTYFKIIEIEGGFVIRHINRHFICFKIERKETYFVKEV